MSAIYSRNFSKHLLLVALLALASAVARADSITVAVNGFNVALSTGSNTVSITVTNNLSNSDIQSIMNNISGLYFNVSGYTGSGVSMTSSNGNTTSIVGGFGVPIGTNVSTGWVAANFNSGLTVCVVCAFPVQNQTAPTMTILGGTGSGLYANANPSLTNGNHNPYLYDTVTFTLYVPGVSSSSTFSNVVVQFGTDAAPPIDVPEPASLGFLAMTGAMLVGGIVVRMRRKF